ncbi:MAG: YqhA family protein [Labilithrix sp.]|nr:YqhA family protein [Labilithrix sp.]
MNTLKRWLEAGFETFLFNARLVVILAVLGSLVSSVLMFIRGVMVIAHTAKEFVQHVASHEGGDALAIALISSVDSFLFATVLLIFAMGIYELFISKIDPASRTEDSRPNWLAIHSLDDLKGAVGKVILMILIVRLFESAVKMKYDHPLHLLYLGCAVLFVAVALYLQHLAHKKEGHAEGGHAASSPPAEAAPAHATARAHSDVVPAMPAIPHLDYAPETFQAQAAPLNRR